MTRMNWLARFCNILKALVLAANASPSFESTSFGYIALSHFINLDIARIRDVYMGETISR